MLQVCSNAVDLWPMTNPQFLFRTHREDDCDWEEDDGHRGTRGQVAADDCRHARYNLSIFLYDRMENTRHPVRSICTSRRVCVQDSETLWTARTPGKPAQPTSMNSSDSILRMRADWTERIFRIIEYTVVCTSYRRMVTGIFSYWVYLALKWYAGGVVELMQSFSVDWQKRTPLEPSQLIFAFINIILTLTLISDASPNVLFYYYYNVLEKALWFEYLQGTVGGTLLL